MTPVSKQSFIAKRKTTVEDTYFTYECSLAVQLKKWQRVNIFFNLFVTEFVQLNCDFYKEGANKINMMNHGTLPAVYILLSIFNLLAPFGVKYLLAESNGEEVNTGY